MIKTKNGDVFIEGQISEILADLSLIIKAVHKTITEESCEEFARECIAKCGRVAYMVDDKFEEEYHKQEGVQKR